jgi:hypothetical protein
LGDIIERQERGLEKKGDQKILNRRTAETQRRKRLRREWIESFGRTCSRGVSPVCFF